MPRLSPEIDHLLRRAGFGASAADADQFRATSADALVSHFVDYEGRPDDVDARIGRPDHARISLDDAFSPDTDIDDARQRWLFRMIHTRRPLQEKMAMFWHNHFATAYRKIAAAAGELQAAKMMAYTPGQARPLRGPQGQIELFRQQALDRFSDLLVQVAQDPAMLIWLDGRSNVKSRPQENWGREVMELFTLGVDFYTESDVRAASRAFTGWNLRRSQGFRDDDPQSYYEFFYDAEQHDTDAKTFSFPVAPGGSHTIPARGPSSGLQDGLDVLMALATHPETARRLARKFWGFFVCETRDPDPAFVESTASVYLRNGTAIRPVIRHILTSSWFTDAAVRHTRYSWPAEFVARAIREVGWQNFELGDVLTPLASMGMPLFEPPNVGGWETGPAWYSTATMLARTNFAATLAASQREFLAVSLGADGGTRDALLGAMLDRVTTAPLDRAPREALQAYLQAAGSWTGSPSQLGTRAAGLARLLVGASEYQLV
ncbi:MAG: DUF1800 domain-containing protein [Vicinamibacterales bacterium]